MKLPKKPEIVIGLAMKKTVNLPLVFKMAFAFLENFGEP
jgi:hypothetical protein